MAATEEDLLLQVENIAFYATFRIKSRAVAIFVLLQPLESKVAG